LYKVKYPVRPRTGFLDRPIESQGLEPDVEIKQTAEDLAQGRDTALEAARSYLKSKEGSKAKLTLIFRCPGHPHPDALITHTLMP